MSDQELSELRDEVQRLRALLGPSEQEYAQLRLDLLGAVDAARGAEAALGESQGRCQALEAEIARLQRSHRWLRRELSARIRGALRKLRGGRGRTPAAPRVP
jgi:chromosome segregation ATPase